jgi:8-oxo-dGTP pyrophosphatase MutT (NUDIX family)
VREVREEIGVDIALDFMIDTVHFYRGEPIPENELVGVVYHCTYDDVQPIITSAEHDEMMWLTAVQAHQQLPTTHWLLPYIDRAELLRDKFPPGYLSIH